MNIRFLKIGLVMVLGMGVLASSVHAATKIANTKHNLSNWGQYSVKASGTTLRDTEVCIFCHAPHNADSVEAPLWNRNDTTASFIMATTQYVKAGQAGVDPQPTTISKKCLSCHDGSIAIGDIRNGGTIAMAVSSKLDVDGSLKDDASNPFGSANGYDLRGGHVISFNYNSFYTNPGLPPARQASFKAWGAISDADKATMFDRNGKMQCHTCHDPHTDRCNDGSKTIGKDPLWRKACDAGKNDSVCKTCHNVFAEYTAPKYDHIFP